MRVCRTPNKILLPGPCHKIQPITLILPVLSHQLQKMTFKRCNFARKITSSNDDISLLFFKIPSSLHSFLGGWGSLTRLPLPQNQLWGEATAPFSPLCFASAFTWGCTRGWTRWCRLPQWWPGSGCPRDSPDRLFFYYSLWNCGLVIYIWKSTEALQGKTFASQVGIN